MRLKTAVLTSAIVMYAAASQAADITSPFYLPSEGNFLSDTSIDYSRTEIKKGPAIDQTKANQKLYYGMNDNWSLIAGIGNTFDTEGFYNNDHNFDYTIGTAYNYSFNDLLTQVGIAYNTYQIDTYLSGDQDDGWSKNVIFNAKAGYEFCSGFMPYVDFTANYALNKVTPEISESRWIYSTFAGIHKMWDNTSADLGVRWTNNREFEKSRDSVYLEGEYNYFLAEDMTVGVFGSYLIGDSYKGNIDYGYDIGANFKVGF